VGYFILQLGGKMKILDSKRTCAELLEYLMSLKETKVSSIARRLEVKEHVIKDILAGLPAITPRMSIFLGKIFSIGYSHFWDLQNQMLFDESWESYGNTRKNMIVDNWEHRANEGQLLQDAVESYRKAYSHVTGFVGVGYTMATKMDGSIEAYICADWIASKKQICNHRLYDEKFQGYPVKFRFIREE
jgi:plasmid maintenance system antidote protein VapI